MKKDYEWPDAVLQEHSRRKHKILREYFARYLAVRCSLPQQSKFRLAIIEGFAGGGKYVCGTPGSPLIFIEELRIAVEQFNIKRVAEGMAALEIESLLILNDRDKVAVEELKKNVTPLLADIIANVPRLHLRVEYMNGKFEEAHPTIQRLISEGRFRSVLFNLDQCGHSLVERQTIVDIMRNYEAAEIFYTFSITSLLAFLQKSNPVALAAQLRAIGLSTTNLAALEEQMSRREWLATAERLVFEAFQNCAPFVSPFSINNPDGWRYWLIHFANAARARQVYNDVLHANSTMQAHFGRAGLHMLSHDPEHDERALYLFDETGRMRTREQLMNDIPGLITEFGDAVPVSTFYRAIFNMTPAASDDIHAALIESDDIEVITPAGGARRSSNAISPEDTIRMKDQKSFFPLFPPQKKK
jgi:three-Cys-motif partner protein